MIPLIPFWGAELSERSGGVVPNATIPWSQRLMPKPTTNARLRLAGKQIKLTTRQRHQKPFRQTKKANRKWSSNWRAPKLKLSKPQRVGLQRGCVLIEYGFARQTVQMTSRLEKTPHFDTPKDTDQARRQARQRLQDPKPSLKQLQVFKAGSGRSAEKHRLVLPVVGHRSAQVAWTRNHQESTTGCSLPAGGWHRQSIGLPEQLHTGKMFCWYQELKRPSGKWSGQHA